MAGGEVEGLAAATVGAAEAVVVSPQGMLESLFRDVGEKATRAVICMDDFPDVGVCEPLDRVAQGGSSAVARLRLAYGSVTAVRLVWGPGAASVWLRLPDPLLEWEAPEVVIAARPAAGTEAVVMSSAAAFIAALMRE